MHSKRSYRLASTSGISALRRAAGRPLAIRLQCAGPPLKAHLSGRERTAYAPASYGIQCSHPASVHYSTACQWTIAEE